MTDNPIFHGRLDPENPMFALANESNGWELKCTSLNKDPMHYRFFTVGGRYYHHYFYYDSIAFSGAPGNIDIAFGEALSFGLRMEIKN